MMGQYEPRADRDCEACILHAEIRRTHGIGHAQRVLQHQKLSTEQLAALLETRLHSVECEIRELYAWVKQVRADLLGKSIEELDAECERDAQYVGGNRPRT